jgi:hypothetical protein
MAAVLIEKFLNGPNGKRWNSSQAGALFRATVFRLTFAVDLSHRLDAPTSPAITADIEIAVRPKPF